jgi:hypothetical protein
VKVKQLFIRHISIYDATQRKYQICYHLLIRNPYTNLMRKEVATFKALITGDVSIEYIDKTPIKRTPGDMTEVSHQ